MHLLCPHCQNLIELAKISHREEIFCPSCGSSFRLEGESTTGWVPPKGQKIGKFELIDFVGQGAFGTVYKARDPEQDRVVAVKVLRATNLGGSSGRNRGRPNGQRMNGWQWNGPGGCGQTSWRFPSRRGCCQGRWCHPRSG
jgi:hypothetical protein